MLQIHKLEELNNELNIVKRRTKKTQIMLCDSHRRFGDYVNMLRYRLGGKYPDVPHFIINKFGEVYQLFDTNYYSNTFNNKNIDKIQIKIVLENLGWLNKNTLNGTFNNWIGDTYRLVPFDKYWRNYFFWDRYTESQIDSLRLLTEHISLEHNIENRYIPTNHLFNNVINFNGIVYKSNFSNIYIDINPSFKFLLNEKN